MNDLTSSVKKKSLPVIAVVGRPNVGKSTLFNRMVRTRRSITDPTPGVTRDPVEAIWDLDDYKIRLVDTGGYKLGSDAFDLQVNEKSLAALKDAELILFLMDVTEITAEDEAFAKILRKYGKKVVLLVNKVDNKNREQDVWNFFSFGFEDVLGVSAEHGYNFDELCDIVLDKIDFSIYDMENWEEDNELTIAILGKPNTGKSTLTNTLLGGEYSLVSDIPGTTRDVLEGEFEFENLQFKVLDTAGIRKKKKVGENIEYYSVNRAIACIEKANIVFLLIDAKEGLTDQDKKIASQIVKKGKGLILVMNKWDLLPKAENQFEAVSDRIRFVFPILSFAPILPLSAKTGDGVSKLLKKALQVRKQLQTRIDTALLNKDLYRWIAETPPPVGKQRIKLRYMTQVSKEPVVFLLFVNRIKSVPGSYLQYIKNKVRDELGFKEIPIQIDLKER